MCMKMAKHVLLANFSTVDVNNVFALKTEKVHIVLLRAAKCC